ncbi:MAG: hypothetical protein ACEPO8_09070 [Rhodothermaceae bacterium]
MNNSGSNNESRLLKTYMPAAALLIVTVTVMIYFKNTQDSGYNIFHQGETLLERFYSKNLKPLFHSKEELSNEDLINFAFNNNLPVAEDKVLFIKDNPEKGKELGIKDAILNRNTNNYEKFINLYCKDEKSKASVDSVLDFYRADLTASVLVSENEAVVVDEAILKMNKNLKMELLESARLSSRGEIYNWEKEKLKNHLKFAEKDDTKLVFLTPDTVFMKDYKFDKVKMAKMLEVEKTDFEKQNFNDMIVPVLTETPVADARPIKEFMIDKKKISAIIESENKKIFNLRDSLMNMSISFNKASAGKLGKLKIDINGAGENIDFEFNFDELGEFIFQTINAVGEHSAQNWQQFGLKIDSAAKIYEQNVLDSLIKMSVKKNKTQLKRKIRKKSK